ncbi:MAG: T9SS type A sorting domain-containing protein, partial [Raineya sp.]|nr:T9SS type A sorting domain-containing protein [Raineya sp.]
GFGMGIPSTPLPVQLVDFSAQTQIESIRLTWRVANELNIERYVVEKSYNAQEFFAIGTVNAQNAEIYTLWDNNPKFGKNYYRLRVEEAGKVSYSNIVVAEWGKGASISVYPVPASEKIYLDIASFENTPVQMRLVNALGQEVFAETQNLTIKQDYRREINITTLARGMYILEVTTLKNKQTFKIVVQ